MMYLRFWYIFEWTNPWRKPSTHWRCSCLNLLSASHQMSIQDFLYSIELWGWALYMQSNRNSGSTMSVYTTNAYHMQTHTHTHTSFLMTWYYSLQWVEYEYMVNIWCILLSDLFQIVNWKSLFVLCLARPRVSPSFKICWHLAWTKKVSEEGGGLSAHWIANWQSSLSHWQLVALLLQQKLQIDSSQSWPHMMKLTCFPDDYKEFVMPRAKQWRSFPHTQQQWNHSSHWAMEYHYTTSKE